MADERIAKVVALLEECHSILEPMYPARHWDEPLPNPPLLDIAQADIDVRDAIIKLRNYLAVYRVRGLFLEKLGEKYPGHPWLEEGDDEKLADWMRQYTEGRASIVGLPMPEDDGE